MNIQDKGENNKIFLSVDFDEWYHCRWCTGPTNSLLKGTKNFFLEDEDKICSVKLPSDDVSLPALDNNFIAGLAGAVRSLCMEIFAHQLLFERLIISLIVFGRDHSFYSSQCISKWQRIEGTWGQ